MIKTVFFGTAEFADKILLELLKDKETKIELVITQPDRPVGRKQIITAPPVKVTALANNIQVLQPESLKKDFDTNILKEFDLGITCQYGLIIPKSVIEAPKYKIINIHPSLLPKYRGASPLQSALVDGQTETGVSIMLIDEKMDHGSILAQEKIKIDETDKIEDLRKKILPVASQLAISSAHDLVQGNLTAKIQDENEATFCKMFEKEDGHINFKENTAKEIYNKFRGLYEWPGIWTLFTDKAGIAKRVKILDISPAPHSEIAPGEMKIFNEQVYIGTKENSLILNTVQPEGKNPISGKDFLNGYDPKF